MLDNKTPYPAQGRIAIQWAASAAATQKANKAFMSNAALDANSLMMLSQKGQVRLNAPAHSRYFRVMVWSQNKQKPDLLTNWVEFTPNKTYIVTPDLLSPAILMSGAGC